ncbi:NACHT domain-containing protein [Pedobacter sp. 22226]|uniref:NACHT domain-containing protein n=1 Tax=Pedobacter sp. 22226 TaxID=3453894 RepID=UPI003F8600DD
MIEEWAYLVKKYTIAGARERFEEICATMIKRRFRESNVKTVRVTQGDGGIDIFIGDMGISPIEVFQCKFFLNGIESSQKQQIRESFRTVMESGDYKCAKWILCIPEEMSKAEHLWWSEWRQKQINDYQLDNGFIALIDGPDIIDSLKEYGLYEEVFDEDLRSGITALLKLAVPKDIELDKELARASAFVVGLKNYFAGEYTAHLERSQTDEIINWVAESLPGKDRLERVLVVKGKKGVGKSTILHDVYQKLNTENNYCLLAVKCDQFYDINTADLAKQLFGSAISFEDIFRTVGDSGKQFIILLDQLDALSQTLSADRRWLQTYITLIDRLLEIRNVRIVISTRSFDLEYDADLRRYSAPGVRQIEVGNLSQEEVSTVLKALAIQVKNPVLLELLRVPYNMELFTKIPDLAGLIAENVEISISRLHGELYSQVLKARKLQVANCLNEIINRMYASQPNLVEQRFLETFEPETSYLVSHGILVLHGSRLSFFHQSFYEYYLARWFVDSGQDLKAYMFEEEQNLYIRSLIKTVIEYLREANHHAYIQLYRDILVDEKVRYHIRYLFITELGQIEEPTEKEKEVVYSTIGSKDGYLFTEVFRSPGWLHFFIENDLLSDDANELYSLFYKNIGFYTQNIFDYLAKSESNRHLIAHLIPLVPKWSAGLLSYFDLHYPYNQNNELRYFETIKKISMLDLGFALDRLRPVILIHRKNNERLKFDHRYDRVMEHLFKIDPRAVAVFLFDIQLQILKATECRYYGIPEEVGSALVSSRNYNDDYQDRDSPDEKSIESFLIKYYRSCDRKELEQLFHDHKDNNAVPLLILLIKLLRDRSYEFVAETLELLQIIDDKKGLCGTDDFFSLQIRRLIAASIPSFTAEKYAFVKRLILEMQHPYEVYKYNDQEGKRRFSLKFGKKKYLFLKALPPAVLAHDNELRSEYQVLERRYGAVDHNVAMDRSRSRWGGGQSPLSNPNFDKFNHSAWLSSMKMVNEDYKNVDFFKGGILEHSRSFEAQVEKNPGYFYGFIHSLFDEQGISPRYISHGISALIKTKDNIEKTAELIRREMRLTLDREYTQYALWHGRFLVENKVVTDETVEFWERIARWEPHEGDRLNPGQEMSDFINTPRGSALENLMSLEDYPQYQQRIFGTIEYILRDGQVPTITLSCGIMHGIAYLNRLDLERSFAIFKRLVLLGDSEVLRYSINPAQYYNNSLHEQMDFYFQEMLLHEELHDQCYFFVSSWVFEHINDFDLYDHFMKLGGNSLKCAMKVAEKFLVEDGDINQRALQVLERCVKDAGGVDLSHELSGLVLRVFEPVYFPQLHNFISQYVKSVHFAKDPSYLFEYLTECAADYPCECLAMLHSMKFPFEVNIAETGYMGDEPLILVLAIYSKLRNHRFRYRTEQEMALDEFDRMLTIPSIRSKALEAMENVLN